MEATLFAAYYFYIVAKQHPAASMAFTSSLPDSLKVDSILAFDLTDTLSVSASSKKGHPPKDKFFNKLAVSATKFLMKHRMKQLALLQKSRSMTT